MTQPQAEVLAKILLVQNLLGQLPDETSIFAFICRALRDVPGVGEARFCPVGKDVSAPRSDAGSALRLHVSLGDKRYGDLYVELADVAAYEPYAPFLQNLCFMVAVVLEERRQRALNAEYQQSLERRVQERTAQLNEEKERLAVTLRSIGDGVITSDVHGRVVLMNRVAEHLCGWSLEEARGRPLIEVFRIINENTRKTVSNPCEKVLSSGMIVELENHTLLVSRDGSERPIADSGAPIRDRESNVIGVVLVFQDMTEKYRLQVDAQRNDRLDALGILAGGIAHDFNNLLGGLFGYLEHAHAISEQPLVRANLERALSVFTRAKDLTQQLLTFSKGGVPVKQTGDIRPLLRESSSFALSGANIACDYDLADDLHSCDFDKNQLGQVIDNIVINAKQAMPNGGHILIVAVNLVLQEREVARLKAGEYLCITISDTGVGIPADKLHRIFDPFYTTKATGNGLGLATCHSIVQKHDGSIEVDSVVGEGTRFRIYLPASLVAVQSGPNAPVKRHRGQGRMMVMDDEETLRDVMRLTLKIMGYEVVVARDGAEALAAWDSAQRAGQPFKAIFMDLTIKGGMGGQEAALELRRRGEQTALFATSGYSGDPVMSDPGRFGFTGSIQKPFSIEELCVLLDRYLV